MDPALTPTRRTPPSPHRHPKSGVLCGSAHPPCSPGMGVLCAPQPLAPCPGVSLRSIDLTQWQTEPHKKSLHAPPSDEWCRCDPQRVLPCLSHLVHPDFSLHASRIPVKKPDYYRIVVLYDVYWHQWPVTTFSVTDSG